MKCIFYDFRRAITGRWFLVAFFASVASLYMSIGNQSFYLINMLSEIEMYEDSFWLDAASLLFQGLQGDFGVMILPALSALPFAAQALQEIKSGALRPAVFRVGRKNWIAGKMLSTFVSGMVLQAAAVIGLLLIFHLLMLLYAGELFPIGDFAPVWAVLLRRMLCGGIWAGVGCLIALLTETASAAYLAPLCLCYAMVMIGTRFFPQATLLNPTNWLMGAVWPLVMEGMATGFALWPTPEHQLDKDFSFKDSEWLMLLIVAMYGGDEFREAMMDAAMNKAKEVIERGKQLIQKSDPAADEPAK